MSVQAGMKHLPTMLQSPGCGVWRSGLSTRSGALPCENPLKSPSRKRVGHVQKRWRGGGVTGRSPVPEMFAEKRGWDCLPVKGPLAFLFEERETRGEPSGTLRLFLGCSRPIPSAGSRSECLRRLRPAVSAIDGTRDAPSCEDHGLRVSVRRPPRFP